MTWHNLLQLLLQNELKHFLYLSQTFILKKDAKIDQESYWIKCLHCSFLVCIWKWCFSSLINFCFFFHFSFCFNTVFTKIFFGWYYCGPLATSSIRKTRWPNRMISSLWSTISNWHNVIHVMTIDIGNCLIITGITNRILVC